MDKKNKYLVVIAGPTAVGKTDIAIELARFYKSVILSADSRQFYRELNIGTAKPSNEQLGKVPHYFINNKSITELYGAGDFEKEAIHLIEDLFRVHDVVFLVGGSGLYINAVLNGVDAFDEVPTEVRDALNEEYAEKGIEWLQQEVKEKDQKYFETVDIKNPQRLIRALEIMRHTGKPFSNFLKKSTTNRNFIPVKIFINCERKVLYDRINTRVAQMIAAGLVSEAKALIDYREYNALKTVGYAELYSYFDNIYTLEEAINKIKQHTRNYAKRQITWFRNKEIFTEFSSADITGIIKFINAQINNNNNA